MGLAEHPRTLALALERAQRVEAPGATLIRGPEVLSRPGERRAVPRREPFERVIPRHVKGNPAPALGGERDADALGGTQGSNDGRATDGARGRTALRGSFNSPEASYTSGAVASARRPASALPKSPAEYVDGHPAGSFLDPPLRTVRHDLEAGAAVDAVSSIPVVAGPIAAVYRVIPATTSYEVAVAPVAT